MTTQQATARPARRRTGQQTRLWGVLLALPTAWIVGNLHAEDLPLLSIFLDDEVLDGQIQHRRACLGNDRDESGLFPKFPGQRGAARQKEHHRDDCQ